jgi:predicted RNase H-like nuclease (RuvC/YqgF family)
MSPGCPMASFTFISRKKLHRITYTHPTYVTSKAALGILLRGLQKLKKEVTEHRERLQEELKAKQKISEEDEVWLDGARNLVDEERVIQLLRDAVDYKKGLEQLSNGDKDVVKRLTALGDSGAKGPGIASKKRKCMALNLY